MKQFLMIGLAAIAIAAFAPQSNANPPEKKVAPVAVPHAGAKGPAAFHTPFKPGAPHVGGPAGPHAVHAGAPFHDAHGVNPRLAHQDQLHRDQQLRDERLHADERARLRDDRIARDRDARLRAERADYRAHHGGGDVSGDGGGGDDSSADSSGGDSSDDSGATDPKAAALSTILNLLQKK